MEEAAFFPSLVCEKKAKKERKLHLSGQSELLTYALHLRIACETWRTGAAEGAGRVLASGSAAASALVQALVDVYNHILALNVDLAFVFEFVISIFRFRARRRDSGRCG